jgi:transposase-like protein
VPHFLLLLREVGFVLKKFVSQIQIKKNCRSKSLKSLGSMACDDRQRGNKLVDTHVLFRYHFYMEAAHMPEPKTLQEAVAYFADPARAFEYAKQLRWPDGNVTCPRCSTAKNSFIKTRRLWFCYTCKKQFTVKVKTIMEDSPIGLDKWMTAFWLLANCRNGISSHELGRTLGVTQTTAWFMLQRIRDVMGGRKFGAKKKLGGGTPESIVEADETWIGGKVANMHKTKKTKYMVDTRGHNFNKTIVQGILDRDLRKVRATVIPNVTRETLQNVILNNVKHGSTVYTDSAVGYEHGLQRRFIHDVVNHTQEYVRGNVHTQGIENFWSLLKRTLRGTYVAVEPFHLSRYVDEQVFRYNNRKDGDRKISDSERFASLMSQVLGHRLTYSDLTGKSDSPHHAPTGTRETQVPF